MKTCLSSLFHCFFFYSGMAELSYMEDITLKLCLNPVKQYQPSFYRFLFSFLFDFDQVMYILLMN